MSYLEIGNFIMFMCPVCGRTIKWSAIYYAAPNTICKCGYPDYITQMVLAWPPVKQPASDTEGTSAESSL